MQPISRDDFSSQLSGSRRPDVHPGAGIRVSGNTISWPSDGWHEVQYASSFNTVSEGGQSASVGPGTYNVINHSTGERFDNIVVGQGAGGSSFSQAVLRNSSPLDRLRDSPSTTDRLGGSNGRTDTNNAANSSYENTNWGHVAVACVTAGVVGAASASPTGPGAVVWGLATCGLAGSAVLANEALEHGSGTTEGTGAVSDPTGGSCEADETPEESCGGEPDGSGAIEGSCEVSQTTDSSTERGETTGGTTAGSGTTDSNTERGETTGGSTGGGSGTTDSNCETSSDTGSDTGECSI